MSEPTVTGLMLLEGEPASKRKAPWGEGFFLKVVFPCQVHQNHDGSYTARCRELELVTGDFTDQEKALNDLRVLIRAFAVSSAKQRVVR